jgi:predicted O-linked N-acetylglucosamine transferase (SPINDLY family)
VASSFDNDLLPHLHDLFERAVGAHQAGRLSEAESLYRKLLDEQPSQSDTLNLLGVLAMQTGRSDVAIDCINRALESRPHAPDYHYNLGLAYLNKGKTSDAERRFRAATELNPTYIEAHNNLANVLKEQGRTDEANEHYRIALDINPNHPSAHNNLAKLLDETGDSDEALVHYRKVIEIEPEFGEAHLNLANILRKTGRLSEAVDEYKRAITLGLDSADVYSMLGITFQQLKKYDAAIDSYEEALRIRPDSVNVLNNLGRALIELSRPQEAIDILKRAVAFDPDFSAAHFSLGQVLYGLRQYAPAAESFRATVALDPDFAEAQFALGSVLKELNQFAAAADSFRRAISIKPELFGAHVGLDSALKRQGLLDEALTSMRDTLSIKSDGERHSALIHTLNCHPDFGAAEILEEARRWNDSHAGSLQTDKFTYNGDRSPERRLKIGYLSPDFRRHPVGYFLHPVFAEHNRAEFEVIAYSSVEAPDDLTKLFARTADYWRDVVGVDDETLADMVNEDGIDILVELAGHTYGNRLLTVARRPAPIQLCGGGHIGTTGVDGVHYLVSDQFHTPAGSDVFYSENLLRLPDGYVCYGPPDFAPAVTGLPARDRGYVTFGCYNNIWKITTQVVKLWAEILKTLPGSRIRLQTDALAEDITRNRIHALFESHGVPRSHVELEGPVGHAVLLRNYGLIDIALDPFPYSGGLTTCEALWMGVPVITLSGETFTGRHSTSHLSNVGLKEFITETKEEYVSVCANLARDLNYLETIRGTLRSRMAKSPLCDSAGYTRNLEVAMRNVWRQWCR